MKSPRRHLFSCRKIYFLLALFPLLLVSCLGLSLDIALNQNGSGTLVLEYRISKTLDSLGRLDGNERWNTIPAGKADFERSMERLPDMKLLSYSSKEDARDLIVTVKMEFSSIRGLLSFLDAGGRRSSFSGDGDSGSLVLTLSEGGESKNAAFSQLFADVSDGYRVKMSMSLPKEGSLAVLDRRGNSLGLGNELQTRGKNLTCSFSLSEVISAAEGISLNFSW